jgi:DNA-binding CsgD family transcriptional regulator
LANAARTRTLIGRDAELDRVEEFLGAIDSGPVALLLEGEIGIGKTTLWNHGLVSAAARGQRVLRCRPGEREAQLAYAALGDLLADVPEAALSGLPAPQRRALEVALLRAEPEGEQSLQRAVGLGLLGVLKALAEQTPTLLAIDDVQWLDHPSESALAFVARRLQDERIGLFCVRRGAGSEAPLELDRAFAGARLERLTLADLDAGELELLLRSDLGVTLSRRTLERVRRAAGGNLFFALEIGRALVARGGPLEPAEELPIPANLQELVRDRLELLPPDARAAAQVASALSRPTVRVVDAALAGTRGQTRESRVRPHVPAAAAAVAAGVLEQDGERLAFAHPLLATVAYQLLSAPERRALHARLAEILDEPEERARHLALAASEADEAVATALDEAARRAAARGAPDAAADLLEQARRLTPAGEDDERRRRGIEAAERHFEAGEVGHSRALLEEIVGESPHGERRARALVRLGWVCAHEEGFSAGADVFFAALSEPTDDVRLRIEILEGLGWCLHSTRSVPDALEYARSALELAEDLGEPTVLAGALALVAFLDTLGGEGVAMATIERALALEHSPPWSQVLGRPDWIHGLLVGWSGALVSARDAFRVLYREALDRGDEHSLPFVLFPLARFEFLTGDWTAAVAHARECQDASIRNGQVGERPFSLAIEAIVEAHLGHVESAQSKIAEGLQLAERIAAQPAALELLATRGFLELSLGDAAAAERTLNGVAERALSTGFLEPALFRFHGDAIEATIALGRRDEAQRLVSDLELLGTRLQRPWPLAVAARGRGMLCSALGQPDAALGALEGALALCDRVGEPFERARTLLVLGTVQRRERKKRPARESLEAALEIFDALGAALWSERTRAELARVGGRATVTGLTATEERVAELLASGFTYQQAADALFVSPKTVQWNVSKIYRKLGIHSRAELIKRFDGSQ